MRLLLHSMNEKFSVLIRHPMYHIVLLWLCLLVTVLGCTAIDRVIINTDCLSVNTARVSMSWGCGDGSSKD